eukprot:Nitzschia sp. Nitz4//scaffold4_size323378//47260//48102//NITZ4_000624-RA/size323378-processed-gene-0.261-mRNA-1//1//CDS//3329553291//1656//frame0
MKLILLISMIPLVAAFVPAILFPARGAFSTQLGNWDSADEGPNDHDTREGQSGLGNPKQGNSGAAYQDQNFLEGVLKRVLGRKEPPKDPKKAEKKKDVFKPKSRKKSKMISPSVNLVPLLLHADTDYHHETVVRQIADTIPDLNRLAAEQMYQDAMRDGNVTLGNFPVEKAFEYHELLRDAEQMVLTTVDYVREEMPADEMFEFLGHKTMEEIKTRWGFGKSLTDEERKSMEELDMLEQENFREEWVKKDADIEFLGVAENDTRWDNHHPIIDEILQMED